MLAMMQDPQGAAMVGSACEHGNGVLALSGALVGLSAVLLSQTFFVSPTAGFQPFVRGLVIALLGGLGSIRGAMVAALVVGIAEALTPTPGRSVRTHRYLPAGDRGSHVPASWTGRAAR